MDTETGAGNEERLVQAVERLTEIQKSILELNREARQIRAHIKDFDVNIDALNLLAKARSKDEEAGGVQVLEDLIRYARETGTPIDAFAGSEPFRLPDEAAVPLQDGGRHVEHVEEPGARGRWKLITQLAVAAAVTSGLFVLIH